jgi:hypothetical protein
MRWHISHRADPRALRLANAHYNRQSPDSPQFVPPGRCMVLLTEKADALWITSFPYAEYVRHEWAGAWMCSCFRNESAHLSSELIREAVAATRWYGENVWNTPEPELGMITFVNTAKVRSSNPGCCYKKAGFKHIGASKGGLVALQQLPAQMPVAEVPIGAQLRLFDMEVA